MSRKEAEEKGKAVAPQKPVNMISAHYEISGGKISRKNKKCPRCGAFMAQHKRPIERWTCGSCSYTEYAVSR